MTYDSGVFQCDTCTDHIEIDGGDFQDRLAEIKKDGWRVYKGPDHEYAHSCPSCTRTFALERGQ